MKIFTSKHYTKQVGLTLVELVIALMLFSIISTTAYSGLSQILRSQKVLDDQRDVQMLANSILSRLSRELQMVSANTQLLPPGGDNKSAYPSGVKLIGKKEQAGGESGDTITFSADDAGQYVPDGKTHSGAVQITYRVEKIPTDENPDKEKVFYLIRDEVPIITPVKKAYKLRMTFPITKRLVSLKFRYFDIDKKQWVDEWPETMNAVPGLVHFSIQILSPLGVLHTFASDIALKRK